MGRGGGRGAIATRTSRGSLAVARRRAVTPGDRPRAQLTASDYARAQTEAALTSPVAYGQLSGDPTFGTEPLGKWMGRYLSWLGYVSNGPVGGKQLEAVVANALFHAQGLSAALSEPGRAGADIFVAKNPALSSAAALRRLARERRLGISVKSDHSVNYKADRSFEIAHFCSCPFEPYDPASPKQVARIVEQALAHILRHRQDYDHLIALCSAPDHFPDEPEREALRCDLWEAPLEKVIDPIADLDPAGFVAQGSGRLTQRIHYNGQWTGTLTLLPKHGRIIIHRVQTEPCILHGSYWMVRPPEAGIAGVAP